MKANKDFIQQIFSIITNWSMQKKIFRDFTQDYNIQCLFQKLSLFWEEVVYFIIMIKYERLEVSRKMY
jgi:hypothetical protein